MLQSQCSEALFMWMCISRSRKGIWFRQQVTVFTCFGGDVGKKEFCYVCFNEYNLLMRDEFGAFLLRFVSLFQFFCWNLKRFFCGFLRSLSFNEWERSTNTVQSKSERDMISSDLNFWKLLLRWVYLVREIPSYLGDT